MSNSHLSIIEKYFKSFQERNAKGMVACYHSDAVFNDEVFVNLNREAIEAMWTQLLKNGKDLEIEYSDLSVEGDQGFAKWTAKYTFSKTGRKVTNHVTTRFTFQDGLIIDQVDTFDFFRWTRQAFGPIGWAIGWTPFFKNKVRSMAKNAINRKSGR